jgi:endoplasmic reticulum chaperone BiP
VVITRKEPYPCQFVSADHRVGRFVGVGQVGAQDKGTGRREKIVITADKGRMSGEAVERAVAEAEQFAEDDRKVRERVTARNGLESYLYHVKGALQGGGSEEGGSSWAAKVSPSDREELDATVEEALAWLEDNPAAEAEELDGKRREVESVLNPVISEMYSRRGADGEEAAEDM